MVEYVGIPYTEVITHAFLPAVISYIALLYLVHLEAVKADMQTLPKPVIRSFQVALLRMGIVVSSIVILAGVVYFGIRFVQTAIPGISAPVVLVLMAFRPISPCSGSPRRSPISRSTIPTRRW